MNQIRIQIKDHNCLGVDVPTSLATCSGKPPTNQETKQ